MRRSSQMDCRLHKSGYEFETRVLGRCTVEYTGELEKTVAREQARKSQPTRKTEFVTALEREFARGGFAVRIYTGVGTSLDYDWGTDAELEFQGYTVALDVTENLEKVFTKADIILYPEDVADPSRAAARIGRVLIRKMQGERM